MEATHWLANFSGEMDLIKALIFLLISPKATNKEMHQPQWGKWHVSALVHAHGGLYPSFFCLSFALLHGSSSGSAGLLGERNYLFITGLCDVSLLIFQ